MSVVVMSHRRRALARALHAHRSKDYSGTGLLLDYNGRGFNPQLGSTTGAEANDPVFDSVPVGGEAYLRTYGVGPNYGTLSQSGLASKSTGTFAVVARVRHATWRTTGRWCGTDAFRALSCGINSNGAPFLDMRSAQPGNRTVNASASVPNAAATLLVRATLNFASATVTFETAPDTSDHTAAVWTQLGAVQATDVTALAGSISAVIAGDGSTAGTDTWDGRVYGVWWYVDGALVRGVDFSIAGNWNATRTVVTGTGSNCTLVRATGTARRCAGILPGEGVLSDAVDDYDTLAHDAAFDPKLASFTFGAVVRKYGNTSAVQRIYGKRDAGAGWSTSVDATGAFYATVSDGTNTVSTTAFSITDGSGPLLIANIDRAAQTLTLRALDATGTVLATSDSPSIASVGSIENTSPIRAGATASGANPASLLVIGRCVFSGISLDATLRAMTAQEMAA